MIGMSDKPPQGATLEYKCRRCARVVEGQAFTRENDAHRALNWSVASMNRKGLADRSSEIVLLSTHRCEDGGMGVADLQGYRIVND